MLEVLTDEPMLCGQLAPALAALGSDDGKKSELDIARQTRQTRRLDFREKAWGRKRERKGRGTELWPGYMYQIGSYLHTLARFTKTTPYLRIVPHFFVF